MNSTKDEIAVDFAQSDVAILDAETLKSKKTCVNSSSKSDRPRQIAYGEGGRVIVCGRVEGTVGVFGRRDGYLIQELLHDSLASAQTVAVRNQYRCRGCLLISPQTTHDQTSAYIFIGTTATTSGDVYTVTVWKHKLPLKRERDPPSLMRAVLPYIMGFIMLLLLLLQIPFFKVRYPIHLKVRLLKVVAALDHAHDGADFRILQCCRNGHQGTPGDGRLGYLQGGVLIGSTSSIS